LNWLLAVLLNKPNMVAPAIFDAVDIFLILDEPQVGHFGIF